MTIRKKRPHKGKIIIDLTGPEGNAWHLLGIVRNTFRQSGASELGESICQEMMKGDYQHLLETFDRYLGDHFILER